MKASEVLNRYANGERDFRRVNLRGQSFKGQDLSGADFTEADIRGANFTNAVLKGTNFTRAIAGLHSYWLPTASILVISLCISIIFGSIFTTSLTLIVLVAVVISAASCRLHNPQLKTLISVATITVSLISLLSASLSLTIHGLIIGLPSKNVLISSSLGLFLGILGILYVLIKGSQAGIIPSATGQFKVGFLRLSSALTREVFKFSIILTGGTGFQGSDLTDAQFIYSNLRHADLYRANLSRACWVNARNLNWSRLGYTILVDPEVRKLLVTGDGSGESYSGKNFKEANLSKADLTNANLTEADLSGAILDSACLKEANLTKVQVLGANFYQATLTGACLEGWNIDSTTKLEDVDCQYVYLLRDRQERRPSSGDFAPGEFTKLFQEALNTVDLIFRNGVDWKAFIAAFKTLQVDNDGTELTVQSIENKGDGVVVVKVSVPEEADKAKLHSEFNQSYDLALKALEAKYHAELKAKDEQITIYREKSADMTEILRLLANRPVTVEVNASAESKAMSDSTDKSQSVNIGGNVTGSTINLGEISGSVSNVINQLPGAPDPTQPGIKELLVELQAVIEGDSALSTEDKADALEQVKVFAELGQNPQQPEKEGLGRKAVKILKGTIAALPDTAKLAEAVSKLLPLITKALGLPF
ncbi:pentapeptide repeat-containing protein [Stenomitos frigidus]|uniref:Pentapeptide repeat-containing protein n=1 Tax=Stenomitos frigidus ULC18 TaxID=2107698 RepID=A0A2T1ELR2_9CYAN|nr:pentapeptide repeat-containing protein [Stenomitos frigidus]PSB33690.1 hypothetical protein C7B82_04190 [Stenomitos frigidus ULC18]